MILQGEIEKLAELSPKELLEHMEYVFGSGVWVEQIEEQVGKCGELRNNRYILEETVKIRGKYVGGMKRERDRTIEWVEKMVQRLRL